MNIPYLIFTKYLWVMTQIPLRAAKIILMIIYKSKFLNASHYQQVSASCLLHNSILLILTRIMKLSVMNAKKVQRLTKQFPQVFQMLAHFPKQSWSLIPVQLFQAMYLLCHLSLVGHLMEVMSVSKQWKVKNTAKILALQRQVSFLLGSDPLLKVQRLCPRRPILLLEPMLFILHLLLAQFFPLPVCVMRTQVSSHIMASQSVFHPFQQIITSIQHVPQLLADMG